MSNIIIVPDNASDLDGCSMTGGSWTNQNPARHMLDRRLYRKARSSDVSLDSTKFIVDLTKPFYVDALMLVGNNFWEDAKVKVECSYSDPNFISPEYDSGWIEAYESLWDSEDLEWEDDNWWHGRLDRNEVEGYTLNFIHLPTSEVSGRYWRISIDDQNNPDDYVEISRLFLGKKWQPQVNYIYGATLGFDARSKVDQSLGGQIHVEEVASPRTFAFSFDFMDEEEAYGQAFELVRKNRDIGEIFVIPEPGSIHTFRRSFLARITRLDTLTHLAYQTFGISYEVEELL